MRETDQNQWLRYKDVIMNNIKTPNSAAAGRLQSRLTVPTTTGSQGLHPLNLDEKWDGWLYVPTSYQQKKTAPFVLILHSAGGDAE